MSRRFAIYYAPPAGSALEAFGHAWLGRDHATGEPLEQPRVEGLAPQRLHEITSSPRHYGFHAMLKAPFCLAEGLAAKGLHAAVRSLAAGTAPVHLFPASGEHDHGLHRLHPLRPLSALQELAADYVRGLEPFRAPLSDEEIARRGQSPLTSRQDAYLLAWAYPYVCEEFRFHMTLTGRLQEPERSRVLAVLAAKSEAITGTPLSVDAIAVYEQADRNRPFLMSARYPLGDGACEQERPVQSDPSGEAPNSQG